MATAVANPTGVHSNGGAHQNYVSKAELYYQKALAAKLPDKPAKAPEVECALFTPRFCYGGI